MEQSPLNLSPALARSTWQIIRPDYSLGLVSREARWWYFEGFFWGEFQQQIESARREQELGDLIARQSDQLQTYELILKGLRWEFTERGNSERF